MTLAQAWRYLADCCAACGREGARLVAPSQRRQPQRDAHGQCLHCGVSFPPALPPLEAAARCACGCPTGDPMGVCFDCRLRAASAQVLA